MIKMMKELKRHEIMRRIEQQDAGEQQNLHAQTIPIPINDNRDEVATTKTEKKVDLKKQSQSQPR